MTDASPIAYREPFFRLPRFSDVRDALARKLVRAGLGLYHDGGGVSHAKRELEIAGLFGKDSDYGGMMGTAIIDMMKLFSMEGHSGFSAGMATSIFEKVSRFEPLTPLTGADDEWTDVAERDGKPLFQNKRCSHVFKEGDYAYDINGKVFRDPSGACFTSRDSRVPVTFPYSPKTEYVDVPASDDVP